MNHTKIFQKSIEQNVTRNDIDEILVADGLSLPTLMKTAGAIRDYGKGNIITYSPKVFIPLTKLCRDTCGYCTFRKNPGYEPSYMSPEEVLDLAIKGEHMGCTEA